MPVKIFEPFSHPTDEQIEAAYEDGTKNWSRPDRANPYVVGGEALSNPLAWAWDIGRREQQYVKAEQTESDRINADTLQRLKAAGIEPRQEARFRGLFGGRP